MASLTVRDADLYRKFCEYAAAEGKTITDFTDDLVFDFLMKKGEKLETLSDHYIRKDDYEGQARNMVDALIPEHIRIFAEEVCNKILGITLWQHLMGTYRLAYDQGQFTAPFLDPSWSGKTEVLKKQSKCPTCKKNYPPRWVGQIFCSNACAAKKMMGVGA